MLYHRKLLMNLKTVNKKKVRVSVATMRFEVLERKFFFNSFNKREENFHTCNAPENDKANCAFKVCVKRRSIRVLTFVNRIAC